MPQKRICIHTQLDQKRIRHLRQTAAERPDPKRQLLSLSGGIIHLLSNHALSGGIIHLSNHALDAAINQKIVWPPRLVWSFAVLFGSEYSMALLTWLSSWATAEASRWRAPRQERGSGVGCVWPSTSLETLRSASPSPACSRPLQPWHGMAWQGAARQSTR